MNENLLVSIALLLVGLEITGKIIGKKGLGIKLAKKMCWGMFWIINVITKKLQRLFELIPNRSWWRLIRWPLVNFVMLINNILKNIMKELRKK